MHALRDTTLAHVHTLIGHLADAHALTATYRILARRPNAYAWGSIRLAPSLLDGTAARPSRRTSFVKAERSPRSAAKETKERSPSLECAILSDDEQLADEPTTAAVLVPGYSADKEGKTSSAEEEEDDEDAAEGLVRAEVEKRGLKEGSAFVFTVKEQLSLVLV